MLITTGVAEEQIERERERLSPNAINNHIVASAPNNSLNMLLDEGEATTMSVTMPQTLAAPAGATVMGEYGGHELPDTKEGIEELCPVCGDKVSGYHYGLLTCESCKGFFKRTVQNKKVYTCVAERSCHIDKSQRKRCPYCRFQKCLDVGMKLEAVRADRMRGGRNKFGPMYKRDRARKLQLMRQKQLAAQQTRAPCQLNPNEANQQGTNNGNNNGTSSVASTMASALPGGFSYLTTSGAGGGTTGSGAGSGYGGGPTIKQELIQIPQLSSSTSSPDSSPSPLPNQHHPHHHHMHQQQQQPHHLHLHHHHMQQQQQQQHHHHLHHNHHHHQMMVDGGGGGGGGGNSSSSNSPIANGPSTVLHSPPSDHHHKGVVHWVTAAAGGPQTTPTSSGVSPATGGGGSGASAASPKAPSAAFQYDSVAVAVALGGPGAAVATSALAKVPALIREFQQSSVDDKEWQNQLFALLQNQTYNQCEVDLFELMCKVLDHSLFAQVDWARNSIFFKDLKQVDDQMKLLQHSWSDMLIMDHIHHRLHNNLPDESTLPNGQKFDLLALAVLGLPALVEQFNDLSAKLQDLKFDSVDYICLKFMILLNPDVRGLMNRKHIHDAHEQVKQALLEYSIECYPQIQDKFSKLMQLVPELHMLSLRGEEFLYFKHLGGGAPTQTLLMEMLHAKKK